MTTASIALLAGQALFSVGLLKWQSHRYEKIANAIIFERMDRVMDGCLSKIESLNVTVQGMNVRGRHAARCLVAMSHTFNRVAQCTQEFIHERQDKQH